jgi:GDP-L-fucose synthase
MPTNLYGPEDNFDLVKSHVLPALLRKIATAKAEGSDHVEVWGTGTPRREFLYSDDLAEACVFLLQLADEQLDTLLQADGPPLINIGVGEDISIRELAELIGRLLDYKGALTFNSAQPDGTPQKLLDVSRIRSLGWSAKTSLEEGIRRTYAAAKDNPGSGVV